MFFELIINSRILLLICQIHDTLVSRLAWQSNWFILQTLKIIITYETLLINTTFMSLLQPGFLSKIWSLDHSFNTLLIQMIAFTCYKHGEK